MNKVYLREVKFNNETTLSIFEGDIKKDKDYWKGIQGTISIRYFELKEK